MFGTNLIDEIGICFVLHFICMFFEITLLFCCCAMCFPGGFWVSIRVKIISTFQLKAQSCTCNVSSCRSSQLNPQEKGFTTHHVLPVWLPGNSSGNNRIIGKHGRKINISCIFLQICFQGVFGAYASGAMLLSVIGLLKYF